MHVGGRKIIFILIEVDDRQDDGEIWVYHGGESK